MVLSIAILVIVSLTASTPSIFMWLFLWCTANIAFKSSSWQVLVKSAWRPCVVSWPNSLVATRLVVLTYFSSGGMLLEVPLWWSNSVTASRQTGLVLPAKSLLTMVLGRICLKKVPVVSCLSSRNGLPISH